MADPALQAQLDAAARQKGFKNYAQYSAWNARQQAMRGYNGNGAAGQIPARQMNSNKEIGKPPPKRNFLQQIYDAL